MLRRNKSLFILLLLSLTLILVFSKTYNAVFVDELIYGRWIYKMLFENISFMFPIYVGKQPIFFWINGLIADLLKNIPYHNISILNVLKTTAIINLLVTAFGISLYLKDKLQKIFIPLAFVLAPFFLIYFSIGTVENLTIPIAILYWYCLSKLFEYKESKNKKWQYYGATVLLGLMVALTKSNASSILVSSLVIYLIYLLKNGRKNILEIIGLIFSHLVFLFLNLYIAFHFAGTESNNVTSLYPTLNGLFNNSKNYINYIPYFFSFSFLFISAVNLIYYVKKRNFDKLINNPTAKILAVNVIVNAVMLLLLKVYYPRYYLIFFLCLFMFVAVSVKKINFRSLSLFLLLDLTFVFFPAKIYRWRIPQIDRVQHFDRSSVHIPYDFKENVLNSNPKAMFLINDDRYGANNLFFGLIPLSTKANFQIKVYEDIDLLTSKSTCEENPKSLIYILGDSSIMKNKDVIHEKLLKSYFTFNKQNSINIYRINCN